ncbi:ADS3, partial [Symbiodinium sp. CCMP2456]
VNESDADEVLESLSNGTGQAAFEDWLEGYLGGDVVSYTVTFPSSSPSLVSKQASRTQRQLALSDRTEFFSVVALAIQIDAVVTSTGYDDFVFKFKGTDSGEQTLDIFVNILKTYFPATATLLIGARANLEVWKLVFRQTLPYRWQRDMWSLNADDASADNFAILDQLESFRINGKFTFRLRWPTMANNQDQIWKQTSNP